MSTQIVAVPEGWAPVEWTRMYDDLCALITALPTHKVRWLLQSVDDTKIGVAPFKKTGEAESFYHGLQIIENEARMQNPSLMISGGGVFGEGVKRTDSPLLQLGEVEDAFVVPESWHPISWLKMFGDLQAIAQVGPKGEAYYRVKRTVFLGVSTQPFSMVEQAASFDEALHQIAGIVKAVLTISSSGGSA